MINSMDGVLFSVIVSERLKMRKSLAINYWQDTISNVKVKSNDRKMSKTFAEFQLVLNFVLFFTLTLFFSVLEKYKLAKIWGAPAPPPQPPPGFYGPVFKLMLFIWHILHKFSTAQKMKFSIKNFFSKWSHLLKKFLMENFMFCAVYIEKSLRSSSFVKLQVQRTLGWFSDRWFTSFIKFYKWNMEFFLLN